MDSFIKAYAELSENYKRRPWWQKILLALPGLILLIFGAYVWFFLKTRPQADYASKTKNLPYEKLDEAMNRNVLELQRVRKEFAAKVARKEEEIRKDAAIFERTKQNIAKETHEQLVRRLEGGNRE